MRRFAALAGLVVLIALVLLLFYRVWVHRQTMELYDTDGTIVERPNFGNLARENFPAHVG